MGVDVPVIGDFHYNGHKLLVEYPEMAAALAKYRINPGNVGAKRHDEHFATIVRVAIDNDKPVRIGVNWGSLDQALLTELMDANARLAEPRDARDVMIEAMLESAMRSAELAEETGLRHDRIIYQRQGLGRPRPRRRLPPARGPLRLPAPPRADRGRDGRQGHRRLDRRAGDPAQRGDRRHDPRLAHARSPARRASARSRSPSRSSSRWACARSCRRCRACPGCGRTTSTFFQEMAQQIQTYLKDRMPEWRETHPGAEELRVAVMGCVVNGPGESKHADIGICLPGTFEEPVAPVFIDGKLDRTLRGDGLVDEFIEILEDYVAHRYGAAQPSQQEAPVS